MTIKLSIELVPSSCWFSNLRDHLSRIQWDFVRKDTYQKANFMCEICGGVGVRWPVECHEIWEYEDASHTQRLKGLVALCPSCHQVKHFVLAQIQGFEKKAIRHLCAVNQWDAARGREYADAQLEIYKARSLSDWDLDLTWIENQYQIKVAIHREKKYPAQD